MKTKLQLLLENPLISQNLKDAALELAALAVNDSAKAMNLSEMLAIAIRECAFSELKK